MDRSHGRKQKNKFKIESLNQLAEIQLLISLTYRMLLKRCFKMPTHMLPRCFRYTKFFVDLLIKYFHETGEKSIIFFERGSKDQIPYCQNLQTPDPQKYFMSWTEHQNAQNIHHQN